MARAPRRILITGAGGFVGRHLLAALANSFPDTVLSTDSFDITDRHAVFAAVRRVAPETCVHLAGIAAPSQARRDPARAWAVNLHGSLALAEAILTEAPDCFLLFVSSGDAYGASLRAGRPATEQALLAPLNVYAATKAAADLALGAMAAEGLNVVRVRPFNHIGPGQAPDFAVAAFARQIARIARGIQSPKLSVGALEPQRDFLDVRDVCAAYVACLRRRDALEPGAILNIASGIPRRIGDVLTKLLELAGVRADIRTDSALLRSTDIVRVVGDATHARDLLDWTPLVPWERTLTDVLADWRERLVDETITG